MQCDNNQTANGTLVYQMAKSCLGKNLCENRALGCAESINHIIEAALGKPIGGGASTYLLYQCLFQQIKLYEMVKEAIAGDIVISPSGYSSKGVAHGHVGIVGLYGILSNNSENGIFEENYTLESWKKKFGDIEGFPVLFFRIK